MSDGPLETPEAALERPVAEAEEAQRFMPRAHRRALIRGMLLLSDAVMLVVAGWLATYVRYGTLRHIPALPQLGLRATYAWLTFVIAGIWIVCLAYERLYVLERVFWGTGEYSRVVRGLSLGVVGFILASFALGLPGISRGWVILAWGFAIIFAIVGRATVRWILASQRRRGRLLKPALIVGHNAEAADLIRILKANNSSGLVPIGCLASSQADRLELDYCSPDVPVLGYAGEIREVLDRTEVDTVIIASTAFDHEIVARIINELRGRDLDIEMSSALFDVTTSRVLVREVSGVPLISIRGVAFTPWKRFVKRTFDLVVGGAIIAIGMPIWLLVALAIVIDSRGPVFYRQQRLGMRGRPFGMIKFRSMVRDADARLMQLQAENEASGAMFKIKKDPRITRVGRFMRKFSIDEFPQLLNVMVGEMSLVGPRPPLPSEADRYSEYHWRRMEVLPGMTGLWQVSGRSQLTFDDMVRLDLFYIENWSVGFDMGLLLRTIPAVVFAKGAY
jgi:exopolysaccharide biosynthesis polyprenyl glycosylphosphotransferase